MYVNVKVAEREYPVKFGFAAMARFGSETKKNLKQIDAFVKNLDNEPLQDLIIFIWCGMNDGHRKAKKEGAVSGLFQLAFEDVADLLEEDNEALERMIKAYSDTMPQAGNGKAQATNKRKRKTSPGTVLKS